MSARIRVEVVPLHDLMEDQHRLSAWRELAGEAEGASYFQTPDWVRAWWETLGGRCPGRCVMVRDRDRLIGFYALSEVRERLTRLLPTKVAMVTNAGSGIGTDHAGWLALDGAEITLIEWLRGQGPMLLRGIPMAMGEALGGRLLDNELCPSLVLEKAPELMSSKLAKTLRNAQRRLEREGVTFSYKAPGQVDVADLKHLYRLNRIRRTDSGDRAVFDDPERQAFHERLLEASDESGGTSVMVAMEGDEVVGVLYGFVWRQTFAYYQIGWDTRFKKLSLGSVLVLESIDEARRQGFESFDFLRGAEEYKYRFGATDVLEGTFAVGRSAGLATLVTMSQMRRMRDGKPESPSDE
jgi:CelD/BcsL family acetyltransferase involved in cellulose biosynthesis